LAKFSSTIKYLWSASGNNWRLPTTSYADWPRVYNKTGWVIYENFTGIPINGIITISIGGTGSFNLIGNPYPSALDADKFYFIIVK
jgi:hypothetical protein